MKRVALIMAPLVLALPGAQAQSLAGADKMLRDAAVNHDMERVKSLLLREVGAADKHNSAALNQAVKALGKSSDAALADFVRANLAKPR